MVPASAGRGLARGFSPQASAAPARQHVSRRATVACGTLIPKIVRVNLLRRHPIALALIALVLLSALVPLPPLVDAANGAAPADVDLVRPTLYTLLAPVSNVLDALTFLSRERATAFLVTWVAALALWGLLQRGSLRRRLVSAALGPLAVIALGTMAPIDRAVYGRDTRAMLGLFAALHRQGAIGLASLSEYWRQHWGDLDAFVAAGADGFEIVNCAPRGISFPAAARARVLRLAEAHDLLVVGASDNHGWGKVTCVWNLSSPSAHGYAANHVIARPIALAQGDWEPWTAAYTQPWLMLRSLSWSERSSWITWILVILIYRDVPVPVEVRPVAVARRLVRDRLRVCRVRPLRHRLERGGRDRRLPRIPSHGDDVSAVEHVPDVAVDPPGAAEQPERSPQQQVHGRLRREPPAVGQAQQRVAGGVGAREREPRAVAHDGRALEPCQCSPQRQAEGVGNPRLENHREAVPAVVVERELDARRIDRVTGECVDADPAEQLVGVRGGGGGRLQRVRGPHAPPVPQLPLEDQLRPFHGAEVGVAEDGGVGIHTERHRRDQSVQPFDVDVDPQRGLGGRAVAYRELVLPRLLEPEVGVAAAKPAGATRVIEGGVDEVLEVRRLTEAAPARDESGAAEHGRYGEPR